MNDRTLEVLSAAVVRILRPLVRVLLRHGVPFGAFAELARRVYVDVASSDFRIDRRKQTVSRVAVITGLTRKEVSRVAGQPPPSAREETERYSRAARVVTGWATDPGYLDDHGEPRALLPDTEFADLVRLFSGDMPSRAVLDELVRVGAVVHGEDGRVQLRARGYIPAAAGPDKLEILGADVAALVATIDHNLTASPQDAWFQRKVLYDNLPEEALPLLRRLASGQGQQLLELLNREMRTQDRDSNPAVQGTGRRTAMVGVYYHECETVQDGAQDPHGIAPDADYDAAGNQASSQTPEAAPDATKAVAQGRPPRSANRSPRRKQHDPEGENE